MQNSDPGQPGQPSSPLAQPKQPGQSSPMFQESQPALTSVQPQGPLWNTPLPPQASQRAGGGNVMRIAYFSLLIVVLGVGLFAGWVFARATSTNTSFEA